MPHTTICFLTEAKEPGEAERRVTACLETEAFFDYSGVLPDNRGRLSKNVTDL